MQIKYENKELNLEYKNKISTHKINNTTQHTILLNPKLIELANIRTILFLYKNKNTWQLTTTEPPNTIEYTPIKTRINQQTSIQLPKRQLNLKDQTTQQAIIKYYPHKKDPITQTKPYITLQIKPYNETPQSTAEIQQLEDRAILTWNIAKEEQIPPELIDLTTQEEQETINNNKTIITLDTKTTKINIQVQ